MNNSKSEDALKLICGIATKLFEELNNIEYKTDKYEYLMKKDPRFISTFPTVCKYMLEGLFDEEALINTLKYKQQLTSENISNDENINIENYYKVHAEYARELYANLKTLSDNKLNAIYNENYNWLKKNYSEAKCEARKNKEEISNYRKTKLINYIYEEFSNIFNVCKNFLDYNSSK